MTRLRQLRILWMTLVAGIVFLIVLAWILLVLPRSRRSPAAMDAFARCLADRGVTMYGAEWCSHCQNEKKAFGESFRLVPYVECPKEPKRCIDLKIEGFPTWIFPDGKRLIGEQGLEKLSIASGCQLLTSGK